MRGDTGSPELGYFLRRVREEEGWTQTQLGNRLGLSRPQVTNIEAGRYDCRGSALLALLVELGFVSDEYVGQGRVSEANNTP